VLVSAAKRLMPRMNQQELCNTAWALGVLGQLDKDTWQEFCDCVVNTQGMACCADVRLGRLPPLELTCATANYQHMSGSYVLCVAVLHLLFQ
jgi:hypothetical protein